MPCEGQNIIPNPGFEEVFTAIEYQWVQPQGAYYHYESPDSLSDHGPRTGSFVNGLCMYNYGENEFLHVKLLEPLKADSLYRLSLFAKLMRAKSASADVQQYIGVYFGQEKLNTHIPGDLYFEPQISLSLPDSNRFEWFELADTLRAEGGESYMTIGYFPSTQVQEIRERRQDAHMREIEMRYRAKEKEPEEDNSWLYLPPDEQKKYLKKQKKKNRKRKKHSESREDRPHIERRAPLPAQNETLQSFAVRYYFDDFCLRRIGLDSTACKPSENLEQIEAGRTINLRNVFFETDEAKLKDESEVQLSALVRILERYPGMTIEIRGYTDNVGEKAYNLELSEKRASAVMAWLSENGIDLDRLASRGFGEADPIETNATRAGRARNRRVTFYIISM
ncbi:MAG TPA: OmpA family protein [Cryomorphaceae bacterium]|nr:OmpA family protein [Cryomorphaceae bacterium]